MNDYFFIKIEMIFIYENKVKVLLFLGSTEVREVGVSFTFCLYVVVK